MNTYDIVVDFGDLGINVSYSFDTEGNMFWWLSGQASPERALLELVLRKNYSFFVESQINQHYQSVIGERACPSISPEDQPDLPF